ncbi:MAG TPA: class I SAM-dependent methyltransferase [Phycisphaerae bacterium]
MKLATAPENLAEWLGLRVGIPPAGIVESWLGLMLTRTVMAAVKLDVFEALASGPATFEEVAARCGTHPQATRKLLNALVGAGCLHVQRERYRLPRTARAWLLKDGKHSFRDQILLRYLEWHWWEHCEEFVRTGRPLRVHQTLSDEDWGVYERGMRSGIDLPAQWIASHLPVPGGATHMLDIGGGHGFFSVAVCRRYPQLRATVLELPEAIRHAAPILVRERMGERVVHRAGNALTDDLGAGVYDVVFMAAVVHHFDDSQNRQLLRRIARSLRPHGIVAVWEPLRQDAAGRVRQMGGLMDLFFGLFSESGTWSADEIADWCRAAGLRPHKPRRPWLMPDLALHVARKPA